jgi:hypothetical protein
VEDGQADASAEAMLVVPAFDGDEPSSRSQLLGKLALLAGVAAGGGALLAGADTASSAPSQKQDAKILNFLLVLEYLQAAFYREAVSQGALRGELAQFARVVGSQEAAHVALLKKKLGNAARKQPTFHFKGTTANAKKFARTARMLEETGVAAYIGQGANLTHRAIVPIARITSVEGRHAAWISDYLGEPPAPRAADIGESPREVLAAINKTGFLKG